MELGARGPDPTPPPRWIWALAAAGLLLGLVWPVFIGLVVGGLVAFRWKGGDSARAVVGAALVAVRPLLLPLLVIGFVAAFGENLAVQLLIGAAIAAVLVPWVLTGQWKRDFQPSERRREWYRLPQGSVHQHAVWALAVVVPAGIVTFFVVQGVVVPDALVDFGGWPTALALTSMLVWGVAVVLRVLGFGISWARAVVAVVVLLAAGRALCATGVLGFKWEAKSLPPATWALVVAAALFGLLVALEVIAAAIPGAHRRLDPFLKGRDWALWRRLPAFGLGVALSATAFMAIALAWGSIATWQASQASTAGLAEAAPAMQTFAGYRDRDLALAFMPVLRFDTASQWTPQPVDGYLDQARLIRPNEPDQSSPDLEDLERRCDNPFTDPCFKLTIDCPKPRTDDEDPCPARQPHPPLDGKPYQEGTVYVRVARRATPPPREPNPFESFGPKDIRDDLAILVQYWFFYDYDEWVAPVLAGRIVQRHEADWEAVTVGLARDRPLFVAFSQHCGGMWQRWRGTDGAHVIETSGDGYAADIDISGPGAQDLGNGPSSWNEARTELTHPAVSVAVGSQANYPPAQADVAPNWASCQGYPDQTLSLLSYVWNIRDRTGEDYEWLPKQAKLVNAHETPMTFPGIWGPKDTFQYVSTHDDPDRRGGLGPRTPSRQVLWRQPVFAIFCGQGWRHVTREKRKYRC
jgi:hypothetical protein